MYRKSKIKTQPNKIEKYISKKQQQSLQNFCKAHEEETQSQKPVTLEKYDNGKQSKKSRINTNKQPYQYEITCVAFILIGPSDLIYYKSEVAPKLEDLKNQYSIDKILKFIQDNMNRYQIPNLANLQILIEDEYFWQDILPRVITYTFQNIQLIQARIRVLNAQNNEVLRLERKQIFLMLSSMFLGIMPQQLFEHQPIFGYLFCMNEHDNDNGAKNNLKIQKLKCIITYFKTMMSNEKIFSQIVYINRVRQTKKSHFDASRNMNLRKAHIIEDKVSYLSQYYCNGVIINSSKNSKIGINALKNGCNQGDLLFFIFPETIVTKLLCQELNVNEALVIKEAKKFSRHKGQEYSFTFTEPCFEDQSSDSIIVFLDSHNYDPINKMTAFHSQYAKKAFRRQIMKASIGIGGIKDVIDIDMPVCIGTHSDKNRDQVLSFIIYWMACSYSKRQMIYRVNDPKMAAQLRCLVRQFSEDKTNVLKQMLQKYNSFREKIKKPKIPSLLEWIKNDFIL